MNGRTQNRPGKQRGAALIIGLVLLMVMTLLAVSTMSTANLELMMAGNAQYKEIAFQLAEAGIEEVIVDVRDGLVEIPVLEEPCQQPELTHDTTRLAGTRLSPGDIGIRTRICGLGESDLSTGNSGGVIVADYAELRSTGTTVPRNARSTQRQGLYRIRNQSPEQQDTRTGESTQTP
jgi:type IV pilus assembly protein PilX